MKQNPAQVGHAPPAELGPTLRDNPELLQGVTKIFLKNYPGKLAALRDAVGRGSVKEIESAAHGLLGSLLIFGAGRSARSPGSWGNFSGTDRYQRRRARGSRGAAGRAPRDVSGSALDFRGQMTASRSKPSSARAMRSLSRAST